jgi:hypothetical protein
VNGEGRERERFWICKICMNALEEPERHWGDDEGQDKNCNGPYIEVVPASEASDYRAALEWYADERTWDDGSSNQSGPEVKRDPYKLSFGASVEVKHGSEKARAALTRARQLVEGERDAS